MENAVRIEPTLYEKLGGEQTIKVVVEEFYVRVLADPLLKPAFEGVELSRLKRHQALFLSQALVLLCHFRPIPCSEQCNDLLEEFLKD
ncbi:MAG: hypothetical protein IIA14_04680 [SAR324 cluster bacterium]|nr:hypothetical protein [SAR324 cluster bacterium]